MKEDRPQLINPLRENPRPEWWYQMPMKKGGDGGVVEYTIVSLETKASGPYTGLVVATVTMRGVACGKGPSLINTTEEVVDHSGCIFDREDMAGFTGWAASNREYLSLDAGATEGERTPCHYAAINRCCAANSGTYVEADV